MAKKLRKISIREVSLCRRGQNPESEILLHKAADSEPARMDTLDIAKALQSATPEALEILKRETEAFKRQVAELTEMNKDSDEMTYNTNPNANYEDLIRGHMEKADLTYEDAAMDLHKRRPDKVSAAFAQDEHNRALRLQAEQKRLYG